MHTQLVSKYYLNPLDIKILTQTNRQNYVRNCLTPLVRMHVGNSNHHTMQETDYLLPTLCADDVVRSTLLSGNVIEERLWE